MHPKENEGEKAHYDRIKLFRAARRVVIKLGTNVVAEADGGLCTARLEPLAASIAKLKAAGRQIVLVSSGAVGLGRGRLGLHRTRTHDLVTRQACAAVGQALLMHEYEKLFGARGVKIAQVLLTEDDFMERGRSSNLRHTMEKLLKLGVVPVVNENDTVSTAELEYVKDGPRTRIFSDNDRLAALVASRLDANALVLLSNVEGLLRLAPKRADARGGLENAPYRSGKDTLVPVVEEITPEVKALAAGVSQGGRGGMLTKLEAAEIAARAGGFAVIADGTKPDILERIFRGEPVGTLFLRLRAWRGSAAGLPMRPTCGAGSVSMPEPWRPSWAARPACCGRAWSKWSAASKPWM